MNSTKTFLILASVFLFAVFIGTINKAQVEEQTDIWVPTEEDILYQDRLYIYKIGCILYQIAHNLLIPRFQIIIIMCG